MTRDEVVAIARAEPEASDAIRRLDARRFGFPLDAASLQWFADQRVDAVVLDYLDKRSRVDWQALRGDVDPATPE